MNNGKLDRLFSGKEGIKKALKRLNAKMVYADLEEVELRTRQDARVFDEVLDWLVRNGRWINVMRLSTLLEEDQVCPQQLRLQWPRSWPSATRLRSGGISLKDSSPDRRSSWRFS